ncbi:hypothetical protein H5410_031344, partial [Solanum commersonii]
MGSYMQWIYHGEQSQMRYDNEVIYNEDENEEHDNDDEIQTIEHREELLKQAIIMLLYNKEKSMPIQKLYPLAMGPDARGRTHTGCIVNGVRHLYDALEKENSKAESDELHIVNDEVYQDISLENDSIVNDSVEIFCQLHGDDIDSVTLDANVIELEAQTQHAVEIDYSDDDCNKEDDTIIEYISDHEENE